MKVDAIAMTTENRHFHACMISYLQEKQIQTLTIVKVCIY